MTRLCFIGAGNMAQALVTGLAGQADLSIVASDPVAAQRAAITALGAQAGEDNAAAVAGADAVILAVKPQVLPQITQPLKEMLTNNRPMVISIAAGVPLAVLAECCGADLPVVRCMPNTPALIGKGITAMFANATTTAAQCSLAEQVLGAAGEVLWVDNEGALDAVTAVSGSGPAYIFALVEAMENAGVQLGLPPATARALAAATAAGAGELALRSDEPAATLRERVTSPGGTTEAALRVLTQHNFGATVTAAINAANQRSIELGNAAAGSDNQPPKPES